MSTPVLGIYYDPFTSVRGSVLNSKPATVEQTAANLANAVVNKVNSAYSLEPPFSLAEDMSFQCYPAVDGTTDLHSLSDKLITLVTPKSEHTGRTAKRWNALNKENEDLIQRNNELESGASELALPFFGQSHLCL
jgi:hypothetical protein